MSAVNPGERMTGRGVRWKREKESEQFISRLVLEQTHQLDEMFVLLVHIPFPLQRRPARGKFDQAILDFLPQVFEGGCRCFRNC